MRLLPAPYETRVFHFALLAFVLVFLAPIAASAAFYYLRNDIADWRTADRSSAGLLPPAAKHPEADVRVFSARTVSWRGINVSHSWIVVKGADDRAYQRFEYTA
ncbi:hypothetical protein EKPJFOCH_1314 [Methylobacterium thuringiense]|uniref:Uncharacterized protein n=1 Tax=Methylobacterium thuringiense TaxID=1003091 RepID=A0ABQ4TKN9_9HYPH|nr:hypothetical protein EKPJFOCH_1314 [Methylobacterium thuringiense]